MDGGLCVCVCFRCTYYQFCGPTTPISVANWMTWSKLGKLARMSHQAMQIYFDLVWFGSSRTHFSMPTIEKSLISIYVANIQRQQQLEYLLQPFRFAHMVLFPTMVVMSRWMLSPNNRFTTEVSYTSSHVEKCFAKKNLTFHPSHT